MGVYVSFEDNIREMERNGLQMSKVYEGVLESEQGYWEDIGYYMKKNNCDRETAIKAIEEIYHNYSNSQSEVKLRKKIQNTIDVMTFSQLKKLESLLFEDGGEN